MIARMLQQLILVPRRGAYSERVGLLRLFVSSTPQTTQATLHTILDSQGYALWIRMYRAKAVTSVEVKGVGTIPVISVNLANPPHLRETNLKFCAKWVEMSVVFGHKIAWGGGGGTGWTQSRSEIIMMIRSSDPTYQLPWRAFSSGPSIVWKIDLER